MLAVFSSISSQIDAGKAAYHKVAERKPVSYKEIGAIVAWAGYLFGIFYVMMLGVQLLVARSWLTLIYSYKGETVECFGDACSWYQDRGADYVDTIFTISQTLQGALWLTLITFGCAAVAMTVFALNRRYSTAR